MHVECIDAQTQTNETYNVQLKTTASGGDPPPRPGQNGGGGPPPAHQTNAGGKPHPAPKLRTSKGATAGSSGQSKPTDKKNAPKLKLGLAEDQRDQMIPLNHTTYLMS